MPSPYQGSKSNSTTRHLFYYGDIQPGNPGLPTQTRLFTNRWTACIISLTSTHKSYLCRIRARSFYTVDAATFQETISARL